jgi:predicted nucleotidyltransferase
MKASNANGILRKAPPASGRRVRPWPWVSAVTGLVPRRRIRDYCLAVAREFHPERIILFGSYAYGRPSADSDVDLLVVLAFRGSDLRKAMQIRSRFDAPFPLDLLVRKPRFISERLRERDMFIEQLVNEGVVVYENQHA